MSVLFSSCLLKSAWMSVKSYCILCSLLIILFLSSLGYLKNREDTTLGNMCLLTVLGLWQSKVEGLIASGVNKCTDSGLKSEHKGKRTKRQGITI